MYRQKEKELKDQIKRIKEAHREVKEFNRSRYEIIGKTLNTLTSPKEKFDLAEDIGERRAILLAIGPKATLRQVNIDELDNPIVIPQKSTKALTTKIIEVKPYKWIQVIDEGKRQIEQELLKNSLSGTLTKNHPFYRGRIH